MCSFVMWRMRSSKSFRTLLRLSLLLRSHCALRNLPFSSAVSARWRTSLASASFSDWIFLATITLASSSSIFTLLS